jgi:hypothetical protein
VITFKDEVQTRGPRGPPSGFILLLYDFLKLCLETSACSDIGLFADWARKINKNGYADMKKIYVAALMGAFSLLSACSSTPKCGDSETTDLVKQIVDEELKNVFGSAADAIAISVNAIRTTDHNEKVDSYSCAAQIELSGPGGKESHDITYTVEQTDKGDEFYVQVYGL